MEHDERQTDRQSFHIAGTLEHEAVSASAAKSPGIFDYIARAATPLASGAARFLQARTVSARTPTQAANGAHATVHNNRAGPVVPDFEDGSNCRRATPLIARPVTSVEAILSEGATESQQEPSIEVENAPPFNSGYHGHRNQSQVQVSSEPAAAPHFPHEGVRAPQSKAASQATQLGVPNPYSKLMRAVRDGQRIGHSATLASQQPLASDAFPTFPPRPSTHAERKPQNGSDNGVMPFSSTAASNGLGRIGSATGPRPPLPVSNPTEHITPTREASARPFQTRQTPSAFPAKHQTLFGASSGTAVIAQPGHNAISSRGGTSTSMFSRQPATPSEVTWIPTYARSLARRRAARITFKPAVPHATALPPQRRLPKRGRTNDDGDDSGGPVAVRRRTAGASSDTHSAKEIAQHILEAVNVIAQQKFGRPEVPAALTLPQFLPETQVASARRAHSLRHHPEHLAPPADGQLMPCVSIEEELARRNGEQQLSESECARVAARGTALLASASPMQDTSFSFPDAVPISDVLGQRGTPNDGNPALQRVVDETIAIAALPRRAAPPQVSIAAARQQRRDAEAEEARKKRAALPQPPPEPVMQPPDSVAPQPWPQLDAVMEDRRKQGLGQPSNPCDLLQAIHADPEPVRPAVTISAAPQPEQGSVQPAGTKPSHPHEVNKMTADPAVDAARPTLNVKKVEAASTDVSEPAKPKVSGGWDLAFLNKNKEEQSAAKEAIEKEIEDRANPLASVSAFPKVSFGNSANTSSVATSGTATTLFGAAPQKSLAAEASAPSTTAPSTVAAPVVSLPGATSSDVTLANLSKAPASSAAANSTDAVPATVPAFGSSPLPAVANSGQSASSAAPSFSFGMAAGPPTALFGTGPGASAPTSSAVAAAAASSAASSGLFSFGKIEQSTAASAPMQSATAAFGSPSSTPSTTTPITSGPISASALFQPASSAATSTALPASSTPSIFTQHTPQEPPASGAAQPVSLAPFVFGTSTPASTPASAAPIAAPTSPAPLFSFGSSAPASQPDPSVAATHAPLFGGVPADADGAAAKKSKVVPIVFNIDESKQERQKQEGASAQPSALFGSGPLQSSTAASAPAASTAAPFSFGAGSSAPFVFGAAASAPATQPAGFGGAAVAAASSSGGFSMPTAAPPAVSAAPHAFGSPSLFAAAPQSSSALTSQSGQAAAPLFASGSFGQTASQPQAVPTGSNPFESAPSIFGTPAAVSTFGSGSSLLTPGAAGASGVPGMNTHPASTPAFGGAAFGSTATPAPVAPFSPQTSGAAFGGFQFGASASASVPTPTPPQLGSAVPPAGQFQGGAPFGAQQPISFGAPAGAAVGAGSAPFGGGAATFGGASAFAPPTTSASAPFGSQPAAGVFSAGQAAPNAMGAPGVQPFPAPGNPNAFSMGTTDSGQKRSKLKVRRRIR